jgi:hypothetical protein
MSFPNSYPRYSMAGLDPAIQGHKRWHPSIPPWMAASEGGHDVRMFPAPPTSRGDGCTNPRNTRHLPSSSAERAFGASKAGDPAQDSPEARYCVFDDSNAGSPNAPRYAHAFEDDEKGAKGDHERMGASDRGPKDRSSRSWDAKSRLHRRQVGRLAAAPGERLATLRPSFPKETHTTRPCELTVML